MFFVVLRNESKKAKITIIHLFMFRASSLQPPENSPSSLNGITKICNEENICQIAHDSELHLIPEEDPVDDGDGFRPSPSISSTTLNLFS